LVIINADAYWRFVVGMTVVTMGEILALTAAPSLMNRFATDRNRGMIQSLASLSGSLGRSIGPVAGSALITLVNYNWTFLILFVLHVVGIVGLLTIRRARA
jgi:MFS family permease